AAVAPAVRNGSWRFSVGQVRAGTPPVRSSLTRLCRGDSIQPAFHFVRAEHPLDAKLGLHGGECSLRGPASRVRWGTEQNHTPSLQHRDIGRSAFIPDPVLARVLTGRQREVLLTQRGPVEEIPGADDRLTTVLQAAIKDAGRFRRKA